MKTRILAPLTLAVTALALPGCIIVAKTDSHHRHATKAELDATRTINPGEDIPSVRTTYRSELEKLHPGMSADEFKAVFPAAVFVEERKAEAHTLHAFSVKCEEKYHFRDDNIVYTSSDERWFYFRDGQFVKWGEPGHWPE